jgi:hypothetical protein
MTATRACSALCTASTRDFHFPNMHRLVLDYVCACSTCQRYKSKHLHPPGLLMPLPVPQAIWINIGLDFVEALLCVGGSR